MMRKFTVSFDEKDLELITKIANYCTAEEPDYPWTLEHVIQVAAGKEIELWSAKIDKYERERADK